MNPETGEIKHFPDAQVEELKKLEKEMEQSKEQVKDKETGKAKTLHKIPEGWIGLPMPGWEVEVIMPPENKRGRTWRVVEIIEGKPGRMVLEPTLKTLKKGKKKL